MCEIENIDVNEMPDFEYVTKKDYHPEPFKKVVVLGESHVAQRMWVDCFGSLLKEFQDQPEPEIINAGIGGNAISPKSCFLMEVSWQKAAH